MMALITTIALTIGYSVLALSALIFAGLVYLIAKTGGRDFTDGYGRWRDRR